jgi:calcineurin-like phosphoesterase family protein
MTTAQQLVDTWYTGDQHNGHELLMKMRGFTTMRQMEDCLIDNHNAVVKKHDRVIHLGDFAHRCDPKRKRIILGALNGSHFLVIGNHDDADTLSMKFAGEPKQMLLITDSGTRVCAMHYAMRVFPGQHRGAIHVYGHSHNRIPADSVSCDVGVDAWGLMPANLKQIQQRLAMAPAHADAETNDFDGGPKL